MAVIITACQTIDPYTGETKTSKATQGALIGAAAGAAIGAISGDNNRERRRRAAIGAGVGVLAGGAVGYYMDQQEARLREKLAGTGVSVTRKGDQVVLNMPGNVTFPTNQSDINSSFYPVLDSVAEVLDEFDKTLVEVVGHTDNTGNDAINRPLSQRRAESVSAYLKSRNVSAVRLSTFGVGSDYPVAGNASPEGRALNRRVEIALLPLTA
jgi:outer membrane protein OmpA-like peptidoglycan-associated protein